MYNTDEVRIVQIVSFFFGRSAISRLLQATDISLIYLFFPGSAVHLFFCGIFNEHSLPKEVAPLS